MLYYLRRVKKIKRILANNSYPPTFEPKRWKNVKSNCYSYALNVPVGDILKSIWLPGRISDKKADKKIWTDVTGKVKKDLDFLGISYRENSSELKEGEWRIAIYYKPTPYDWPIGFHISRQDADGIWSEKPSWKGKVTKIEEKNDNPPDLSEYKLYLENVLILSKM